MGHHLVCLICLIFVERETAEDGWWSLSGRSSVVGSWNWQELAMCANRNCDVSNTGWWFGCHQFYFPRNIGFRSSSQLTFTHIFFRTGWRFKPPSRIYLEGFAIVIVIQPSIGMVCSGKSRGNPVGFLFATQQKDPWRRFLRNLFTNPLRIVFC